MGTSAVLGAVTLPGRAESAGEARQYARKLLEAHLGAADERVPDAVLAISEAVTNAVTHSESRHGGEVTLTVLALDEGRIRVEVSDGGGGTTPIPCRADETATTGRGLAIIQALAARTGRTTGPGHATYWFEL